jgi:hypothetical protein
MGARLPGHRDGLGLRRASTHNENGHRGDCHGDMTNYSCVHLRTSPSGVENALRKPSLPDSLGHARQRDRGFEYRSAMRE